MEHHDDQLLTTSAFFATNPFINTSHCATFLPSLKIHTSNTSEELGEPRKDAVEFVEEYVLSEAT
jgi:hypothetical protein